MAVQLPPLVSIQRESGLPLSEFSLIEDYFSKLTPSRQDVSLGIGDDCALLQCPPGKELAVSIDTLVEGVHFFDDVAPRALGYKSLAVNLSDLAAMGAEPAWFTLALTLPEHNSDWLNAFTEGLALAALPANIQLVGGDTTRGPLTVSIQVHGLVPLDRALRRDGAKTGDRIYVSGTLGDAGAALKKRLENWSPEMLEQSDWQYLQQRLEYPTPRYQLGQQILCYASSAIDISDGLLADLGHILERSHKGAVINVAQLPFSASLKKLPPQISLPLALGSGDDYELCFTVSASNGEVLEKLGLDIRRIGEVTAETGLVLKDESGKEMNIDARKGYDHFGS